MDKIIEYQKRGEAFSEPWTDYCEKELNAFFENPLLVSTHLLIPVGYVKSPIIFFGFESFKDLTEKLESESKLKNAGVELVTIFASKKGPDKRRLGFNISLFFNKELIPKSKQEITYPTDSFKIRKVQNRIEISRFITGYAQVSTLKTQIKKLMAEVKIQHKYIIAAEKKAEAIKQKSK